MVVLVWHDLLVRVVGQLDHLVLDEDVADLDVPEGHVELVEVRDRVDDLAYVAPALVLVVVLLVYYVLHQRLLGQLLHHARLLRGLEYAVVLHQVRVVQPRQQRHCAHRLLGVRQREVVVLHRHGLVRLLVRPVIQHLLLARCDLVVRPFKIIFHMGWCFHDF